MTLQEIYQNSATRLLEQNAKSKAAKGPTCAYFSESGNCCAVGLLLKDSEEIKELILECGWNSEPVFQLLEKSPIIRKFLGVNLGEVDYHCKLGLISQLQNIHDRTSKTQWRRDLIKLGERFGLDTSFLTTQPA